MWNEIVNALTKLFAYIPLTAILPRYWPRSSHNFSASVSEVSPDISYQSAVRPTNSVDLRLMCHSRYNNEDSETVYALSQKPRRLQSLNASCKVHLAHAKAHTELLWFGSRTVD